MVNENDVTHIAELADLSISAAELPKFTEQFNSILEYFDILDTLEITETLERRLVNVFREDVVKESIDQEEALKNSHNPEEGYIRAPKVI